MNDSTAQDTGRDKERTRKARRALQRFSQGLRKACRTFNTANDWVDFVSGLDEILSLYQLEIPMDRQGRLRQAMQLTDTSRSGISEACNLLDLEIKQTIKEMRGGGCSCGCLAGALIAGLVAVIVLVIALAAGMLFLSPPVNVIVINEGCSPMLVRQGVPPSFAPILALLRIELPETVNTDDSGTFQVPGLPLSVAVDGRTGQQVRVSLLGVGRTFQVSEDVTWLEVDGLAILGSRHSVAMSDPSPHQVFISCR